MKSENLSMRDFAENLWQYMLPRLKNEFSSAVSYYRAVITKNNGDGTLTIQRPYDSERIVHAVSAMSGAQAGTQVVVLVFGSGAQRNEVVISDGAISAIGGETEVSIDAETPPEPVKIWIDTDENPDPVDVVTRDELIDLIYPIGSIYSSLTNASPEIFLGGTWNQINGCFLLASSSKYPVGTQGGSATVTLTEAQLPSHAHNTNVQPAVNEATGYGLTVAGPFQNRVIVTGGAWSTATGGNAPHNNMPPYLVVYMWQRVA